MEFSFTEGNFEADYDINLILSTYCEAGDIEKIVEEIERLNLNMPVLVMDGCVRSVSCVLYH